MLIDSFGRKITYLRVSVTERCNFRCRYCMPEKPFSWVPKENLLTYEELFMFIKAAIDEGITKIRLTGGEPTLREGLDELITMITNYAPTIDLAMTTNGYLLEDLAARFAKAGLKRINISLDSLRPETAAKIAQKDVLPKVLAGIEAAIKAGMSVKVNMVPLKGINDDEILDILNFGRERGLEVRFIEYMANTHAKEATQGMLATEILERIAQVFKVDEEGLAKGSPSRQYRLEDGYRFGIIEPHKEDFCASCNRIRLTAEGDLIPCLYFDEALSIREALKRKDLPTAVAIFKSVIAAKPEKNRWSADEVSARAFYETGG